MEDEGLLDDPEGGGTPKSRAAPPHPTLKAKSIGGAVVAISASHRIKRPRSQSLDTGAPLMPPPFVPTLWDEGGVAGEYSDSDTDSDDDHHCIGEHHMNVMNILQSGQNQDCRKNPQNSYHNRKYDGDSVVRVRAQVMMRDDSTGGWVPVGGGGLSNVSVQKQRIYHDDEDQLCKHEYLIDGKRISDQAMVLNCTIKRDFEYNRVMPTFHHWRTDNKKFGLTFQTAADARAFDKGVRMAIMDLLNGASATSPLHLSQFDLGDEDVFMTLDLPVGKNPNPNRTAVTTLNSGTTVTSVTSSSIAGQPLVSTDNSNLSKLGGSGHSPSLDDRNGVGYRLHRSHVPVTSSKSASPPSTKTKLSRGGGSAGHHYSGLTSGVGGSVGVGPGGGSHETSMNQPESDKDYSYVKFPRRSELPHDYSYPLLPEGLRRTTAAATDPPSWPPYKPGNALAETPIKKGDSSSSSSSSKKSSRRSLPSLVLSCAGGSPVEEEPDESELPHGLLNAVEMGVPPQVGGGQGMHGHGPAGAGMVTTSGTASSTSGTSASNTYNTLTCLHCRKSFKPGANRKGECPMAPNDKARSFVEHVSCLQCANCFVYHCMSDSEGDYGGHPCDCANVQGSIWKRWLGLSFLAILVPCLCCYPPLMACYRCGAACNMCGGKHFSPKNEPSY